ncbi:hypothetical protein Leryth_014352 [Lithospermum erythrorhizon]|uniref:Secondary carrier transporter n=1 Tax=Lithospermum erythrorhizon TaxID=34254 RepID=A0AAV3Q542_LITER|nr:hypothetical protein Leryth_014352 [Lithospermum erythrorhizon]
MGGWIPVSGGGGGGLPERYPGRLTSYVVITLIAAAMGGLIFGYDIGVSGGVTSMESFLKKFFPSVYHKQSEDKSTNQYCKFDSQLLTLFTSSLYLAALVASFFASHVTKRFGRRISMISGGIVFLIGAILNAAAVHVAMLIIGRILLGVGIGFANQSVPLYLSEMAPYKHRGKFNLGFQLSITIGILFANVLNYFFAKIDDGWGWRLSLGFAGLPAIIIIIASIYLPDTPNSLLEREKHREARELLQRIRGVDNVDAEYNDLVLAGLESKKIEHPWRNLGQRKYRPQLVMAVLIPAFQQLTGMNIIMFYAPVLFRTVGFGSNASLFSALITGIVNMFATFVSIYGIDRWGRRALLIQGGIQMLLFQAAVGGLIASRFGISGNVTIIPSWFAIVMVVCICCFVAGFAWSWGPLGWLIPSEIFPLEIRSAAQSVTVATNMFFTFLIAQVFLTLLCHMKFGLFFFFAACVLAMTLFVFFFLPETKNIPIEEMTRVWKNHWFWKRFIDAERSIV